MSSGWNLNLTAKGTGRGRGRGRGQDLPSAPSSTNNNHSVWQGGRGSMKNSQHREPGTTMKNVPETPDERFQKASAPIKKSVQQHLERHGSMDDFESSSEDEDDVDDDSILQTMYKSYSLQIGSEVEVDLDKTKQNIQDAWSGGNSCAICIGKIRHVDAVWNCRECCTMLHLHCIQNWAKQAVMLKDYQSEEKIDKGAATWPCPNCRSEYKGHETPHQYTCFCSKKVNPPPHPWLAPHSCGESCNKRLKPECGHSCLLLCHPGPCPPCPQTVKYSCHCGAQPAQLRRCCSKAWSCGSKCNKLLACGQHHCSTPCHPGECAPCPKTSQQLCKCGKHRQMRPCISPQWTCTEPCQKTLPCQQHQCEKICHEGKCGACPRSGKRTCPCGKTEFDLPCTEEIPTCGDTCEKLLQCKSHKCMRACHNGPCEKCLQMSTKKCRCGLREKSLPCTKEYLCDTKCNKTRPCTRHQCKRRCCDGNCPPCEQVCGKPLTCKNHKCPLPCHPGPCYLCPETVDIFCFCKSTKITVPCGVEKVTRPPKCREHCRVPPDCHHTRRDPHRCHFRRCPPCKQVCKQKLPNCSHTCPLKCHSAVLTQKMEKKTVRDGPWVPAPKAYLEVVNYTCPPCEVPVPVECLGKHKIWDFPCSSAKPFSCEAPCGRTLRCTNHRCQLPCHTATNTVNMQQASKECQDCEEPCSKPRPEGCTHECSLPCHPGSCSACNKNLRVTCHCKSMHLIVNCRYPAKQRYFAPSHAWFHKPICAGCNDKITSSCFKCVNQWTSAGKEEQNLLSSCKGPCRNFLQCSHLCSKSCHTGECSTVEDCKQKKSVQCPCKRKKKNFFCCDITSGNAKLECDKVCEQTKKEKKQKQQEAEKLAAEEKEKQKQRDQEEYERLTRGKKHKTRKVRELRREKSFLERHWKNLAIVVGVVATVAGLVSIALYG